MAALGAKLRTVDGGRVAFWCPGCGGPHLITVSRDADPDGPCWGFDGDGDCPTFTPSILVRTGHFVEPNGGHCDRSGDPDWPCDCICCHSFVTKGRILFLQDCTHHLAGQTVDLPDFPIGGYRDD
ncbi:MAG: ammonia monooxygenase [Rhodobacter sp.]|nr:ammonia monooxygenase [Rhodobacter sp.]MCA3457316.1 ammonia monooxygenase [Rhodobacter sp.]MCA3460471.1 ammonia monooxygenase [Rhodobacter sp.]MCA3464431.1 ammonia monooxygenase [Rhodobacter sp.]MCA3468447.1 ammonia monooxygenase [Rhodobacter sp.]